MRVVTAVLLLFAGADALDAQRLSPLLEVKGTVQDSGGVVVPGVYRIAMTSAAVVALLVGSWWLIGGGA